MSLKRRIHINFALATLINTANLFFMGYLFSRYPTDYFIWFIALYYGLGNLYLLIKTTLAYHAVRAQFSSPFWYLQEVKAEFGS